MAAEIGCEGCGYWYADVTLSSSCIPYCHLPHGSKCLKTTETHEIKTHW